MLGATLSGPVAGSRQLYRDPTYRDSLLAHINEKYFYMKTRDVARSRQNAGQPAYRAGLAHLHMNRP